MSTAFYGAAVPHAGETMADKKPDDEPHYHIVGGGPVGYATALLLAKDGIRSTVYESRAQVVNVPEESYPIGVNARGLHTLGLIDPSLAAACRDTGKIINAWEIYGSGGRKVADLPSGVVFGTSRARVNLILAEAAVRPEFASLVTVVNNYRLRSVRLATRELVFEERLSGGGRREVVVATGQNGRVVAADGCNSAVRGAVEQQDDGFACTVTPWKNEFRVIFAPPGASAPLLDETVHYIFAGFYAATVDKGGEQTWTCVMGARDGAPQSERALLLSDDASDANVAALRALLQARAPQMASPSLFGDDELRRYFGRRTFRGALVRCSRAHVGEWLVLLGDAAHSVLPPTGEGINSGLEDAAILAGCVRGSPDAPFSAYEAARAADVAGLLSYATYLNDGFDLKVPGEAGARLAFTILESVLSGCCCGAVVPLTTTLFGPPSAERAPYGPMTRRWRRRKAVLLPLARLLIYPWAWLFALLALPWAAARGLGRCCARCCCRGARQPGELSSPLLGGARQRTMRPPIDLDGADGDGAGGGAPSAEHAAEV